MFFSTTINMNLFPVKFLFHSHCLMFFFINKK